MLSLASRKDDGRLPRKDQVMAEPTELVSRVDGIDRKLDRLSASVDERFDRVDERFDRVDKRFEAVLAEIAAEGEKTRRHFDMVAEQMLEKRQQ